MISVWNCSRIQKVADLINLLNAPPEKGLLKRDSDKSNLPSEFHSERLEQVLESMCKRGDFTGAVIADENPAANIPKPKI